MRAFVRFRDPRGEEHELEPGDIVGRSWKAALWIQDPRVSECHAMVSLRDGVLRLLALRGRFSIQGAPLTELTLAPGQVISLADGVACEVVEVHLPDVHFGIEGPGIPRQILQGIASIRAGVTCEILSGFVPDADAVLWSDGLAWKLRDASGDRAIFPGEHFDVGAQRLSVIAVTTSSAGQPATQLIGGIRSGLTLSVRYDTVHIHREPEGTFAIDGLPARILTELALMNVPARWDALAHEFWPDKTNMTLLRQRWDAGMARLRRRLREERVRPDLIRSDGSGNVEICLTPHDRVDDQT